MKIIGFELFSEFNLFYPKVILVCIILFILITSIAIKFNGIITFLYYKIITIQINLQDKKGI